MFSLTNHRILKSIFQAKKLISDALLGWLMTKGLALTIGLNAVDPQHYGDWSGELMACEADAEDMAEIAKSKKFQTTTLLTKNGTREKVAAEIRKAHRR